MKKVNSQPAMVFLIAIACFLSGCLSDDDPRKEPLPGAGGALKIKDVKCCSLNISWIAATDEDYSSDELKYKLVRSSKNNISSVSEAEVNGIAIRDWFGGSGEISADVLGLDPDAAHYFNVIVKDPGNHKAGYNAASALIALTWERTDSDALWSGRALHGVVVFDNKLWVLGGYDGVDTYKNDVWYSEDGWTWHNATLDAPWSVRAGHSVLAFDNKLWVMGGHGDSPDSYKNDVWYSEDGMTWSNATLDASWDTRSRHASVVFDDKMWVFGGSRLGFYRGDVWSSSNGETWTEVSPAADWSIRTAHAAVVFNGEIWVTGGKGEQAPSGQVRHEVAGGFVGAPKNDVWHSENGEVWTRVDAPSPWTARHSHGSVVFGDRIWVLGGDNDEYRPDNAMNDVWSSNDGVSWTKAGTPAWNGRVAFGSVIFKDKIRILGGQGVNCENDVWSAD